MKNCAFWVVTPAVVLMSSTALAATYEVHDGEDLFAVLASLEAGDEVVVYSGSYPTPGYRLLEWHGSEQAHVVVRAADGESPVVQGDPSQNAMNVTGEYFEFRGFEIRGGSHGLRLQNVHDAVIEDLEIHETDDVALSANMTGNEYYNIRFSRLHLHDTGGSGEGMYLGCNNAGCLFHDNVIEDSWIHDTNHGTAQGDGIEIKQGSYGNLVRNNVIYNTKYPCVIVYGTQGHAQNVIENNVLWDCGDSGIQAAADAVLRNNLIFRAGNGINSHAHQGAVPSNMVIVNNTVIASPDTCLRASDWAGSTGIVVADNAFYCDTSTAVRLNGGASDILFANNVLVGAVSGVDSGFITGNGADQDFEDPANLDAWPTDGSPVIDAGDQTTAADLDFNWNPRDSNPDVGAYEWAQGGNPGWQPGPGFRELPDGGLPDAGPGADAQSEADGAISADGTLAGDAAQTTDGASSQADGGQGSSGDSGCSCRAAGATHGMWWLWLLSLLAVMVRRRSSGVR